jgi:excisionase family DNA binding protein
MHPEPIDHPNHDNGSGDVTLGQPARLGLSEFPDVGRVEEVAAVLRCSKWCVYDLIAAGPPKSIRLGRSIRVTRRALDAFLSG